MLDWWAKRLADNFVAVRKSGRPQIKECGGKRFVNEINVKLCLFKFCMFKQKARKSWAGANGIRDKSNTINFLSMSPPCLPTASIS